jgi:hypothetical protein
MSEPRARATCPREPRARAQNRPPSRESLVLAAQLCLPVCLPACLPACHLPTFTRLFCSPYQRDATSPIKPGRARRLGASSEEASCSAMALARLLLLLAAALLQAWAAAPAVRVETVLAARAGAARVVAANRYEAHVTLWLEAADGALTPSGWSTRAEDRGDGRPFAFQPGQGLIEGWTRGVLEMREGERARIHVPYELGYGTREQGSKGGAWYIPSKSNLLFDIEILGKVGAKGPAIEEDSKEL